MKRQWSGTATIEFHTLPKHKTGKEHKQLWRHIEKTGQAEGHDLADGHKDILKANT